MKKFTWALVSTGRLEDGEKFYISLKGPDGEPWANPIEPEQIMQEIAALKQQFIRITEEALSALAGAVPTPEEGYAKSPFLLKGDIMRLRSNRDELKSENERLKQQLAEARGREATGGEG